MAYAKGINQRGALKTLEGRVLPRAAMEGQFIVPPKLPSEPRRNSGERPNGEPSQNRRHQ